MKEATYRAKQQAVMHLETCLDALAIYKHPITEQLKFAESLKDVKQSVEMVLDGIYNELKGSVEP